MTQVYVTLPEDSENMEGLMNRIHNEEHEYPDKQIACPVSVCSNITSDYYHPKNKSARDNSLTDQL